MNKEKRIDMQEFREISKEFLIHIEAMTKKLEEYGINSLASVTFSADGYINMNVHGTGWGLTRIGEGAAEISIKYTEGL